jgi:phosphoglycolate phosphatase
MTITGRAMSNLSGYTVAFDLDGTLIETVGDIYAALNLTLAGEGLPPAELEDVHKFIGQGARALIIRACAVHGLHHPDDKVDALTRSYIAAYTANIAAHSHPYPGLLDALDTLQSWGATLCVCTNKRTDLSVQLLTALNLQHRFAAIVGSDSVKNRKPHPDHYHHAIRAAHGDPARSVMVGDSINDVLSAKAAGAPVAIYAYGYTDTAPDQLGADAVFTQFTDLPDLLVRLLNR